MGQTRRSQGTTRPTLATTIRFPAVFAKTTTQNLLSVHHFLIVTPRRVTHFVNKRKQSFGAPANRHQKWACRVAVLDLKSPSLDRAVSAAVVILILLSCAVSAVQAQITDQDRQLARSIFKQLIEINTTDSVGSTTLAAKAMADRLLQAGFPAADVQVLGPNDRKGNLTARLRGSGAKKPMLLMGHLDVVEARHEDWSMDPFEFNEKDGFFYGRGTQDMKGSDAVMVATMMRLRTEGYRPDRDIILALTADEEGGKSNGIDWLLNNHRDLITAEFALNPDGGGIILRGSKPELMTVDATEKLYADYQLEAVNPGGHSSLPVPDNAIYHVTDALARLERHKFPFELNAVTRAYFERSATTVKPELGANMKAILRTPPDSAAVARLSAIPLYNAMMHTTCVATRLDAGHANNALPQMAHAIVNCRILPGHSREEIRRELIQIFADPKIRVRYVSDAGEVMDSVPARRDPPPVKLQPDVMKPLEKIVNEIWPGIPVIPTMATGASDGIFTNSEGIPTYAVSGMAIEFGDDRAHGRDERVAVKSFYDAVDFYYRYVKALSSPN
jgi:acetylornithine deacetylase/succinyl-diaminopimelate desuccinylase-like protein